MIQKMKSQDFGFEKERMDRQFEAIKETYQLLDLKSYYSYCGNDGEGKFYFLFLELEEVPK